MKKTKKVPIAVVLAVLAALGYGGYTLIKEKELTQLRTGNVSTFKVTRVIDGDTFELEDGDVVRLLGVDAPEEGECYYKESKMFLEKLILSYKVELREDVTKTDDFGRLLRYAILPEADPNIDNVLVDELMVESGSAEPQQNPRDKLYWGILLEAREEAIRESRGMWNACEYNLAENSQNDTKPTNNKCVIKGNVSIDTIHKVYFVPECSNYTQVKIDPARGEKYFCSETEAKEADFLKAKNCP